MHMIEVVEVVIYILAVFGSIHAFYYTIDGICNIMQWNRERKQYKQDKLTALQEIALEIHATRAEISARGKDDSV